MQIIIDISKEDYDSLKNQVLTIQDMFETVDGRIKQAIISGITFPEGITNGKAIKMICPNAWDESNHAFNCIEVTISFDEWIAPFKGLKGER